MFGNRAAFQGVRKAARCIFLTPVARRTSAAGRPDERGRRHAASTATTLIRRLGRAKLSRHPRASWRTMHASLLLVLALATVRRIGPPLRRRRPSTTSSTARRSRAGSRRADATTGSPAAGAWRTAPSSAREGPNGEGGLIYTEQAFANFALAVDVAIDWPFDSGIFLRMAPEGRGAQITIDYRDGGEVGGIYSDGWLEHNPGWHRALPEGRVEPVRGALLRRADEDPRLAERRAARRARRRGGRGLRAARVDRAAGARATNAPPDAEVRFRNMKVRELPEFDAAEFDVDEYGFLRLKERTSKSGWRSLLDGSLGDWEPHGGGSGFELEDEVLAFLAEGSSPYLKTRDDFQDFELQLDFKTAFMANSGLFLRGARTDQDPAYSGCESPDSRRLQLGRRSRSRRCAPTSSPVPSTVPYRRGDHGALRPIGWWNTYQVRYEGSQLTVRLNGTELYSVDTHTLDANPPFAERAPTGFIGLQRHAPAQVEGRAYAWFPKRVRARAVALRSAAGPRAGSCSRLPSRRC